MGAGIGGGVGEGFGLGSLGTKRSRRWLQRLSGVLGWNEGMVSEL